jgi:hypothetical protein
MEESIFESIKSLLGPDASYDVFDQDILIHINTAISVLTQLGVGPATGFMVTGADETWQDFIGDDKILQMVKTYIYMKVKMAFDPPANSSVLNAYNEACKEYEWRLNVETDPFKLQT